MQTTKADALYAGADLHGNNVFLSLCDMEGNNIFRRRVKPNLAAVNAALEPFWNRIAAFGVESTFNWYWLDSGGCAGHAADHYEDAEYTAYALLIIGCLMASV